jgi:hypothetical protein
MRTPCASAHAGAPFSSLQALLCANNRITDWATVQCLAELPLLSDVRLSGNLLFTSGGGERFEVRTSSVCNTTSTPSTSRVFNLTLVMQVATRTMQHTYLPCCAVA